MYEIFNKQALALGKQFTNNVIKAQGISLKALEDINTLQLKAFEDQANAQVEFAGEAAKAKDFDGVRSLWAKSADFSRDAAEKFYATQQNVWEVALKSAQNLGELAREQIEAGSEAINAAPAAIKKAAK
ncbi:MAG TPA: phasin family protein [Rhodanobacteraceae bacterium]|nr:phasin family protein [Rhodanobacteraceae bacterium]